MWVSIMVVITLQPLGSAKEAADPTLATDVAKLISATQAAAP